MKKGIVLILLIALVFVITSGYTTAADTLLSQGKAATASSFQAGNEVAKGNDGSTSTRWSASSNSYPQWWKVDLSASCDLTRVDIAWYSSKGRAYKYKIEVSSNDSTYTTVIDKTGNTTKGDTSDSFTATARYVRITVTGCSAGSANASFYECEVYGAAGPTPTPGPTATPTPTPTPGPTAPPTPTPGGANLALNKAVTVSSIEGSGYPGSKAVDGNTGTRWSSAFSDPQWIYVDLGASYTVSQVKLNWQNSYGKSYTIQLSADAASWTDVYSTTTGDGGIDDITFAGTDARYVRMYGTVRATGYGYSLWEFEIYGSGGPSPTPTPTVGPTATPTPTPTLEPTPTAGPTPTPGGVDFGPNVYIFDPGMSMATIQSQCDTIYNQQVANQFGSERYALLFKPGSYTVNVGVGFYTSVMGLGQRPDDVNITGSVRCEADWMGGNATCNFWRTAENYADTPTYSASPVAPSGTETWGASQAAPMRRVHIKGALTLWDPNPNNYDGSWSSGGFIVDSKVDNQISSASQQQYVTRNTQMGSWSGSNWNMVFVGDVGAPADSWPSPPYTTISQTPVIREKPFLYIDGSGNYLVFVPALRTNCQGITWASGMGSGTSLPLSQFHIAKAGTDTAATINTALSQGKHVLFTPGIYHLSEPIQVNNANTIILGMGLPTLIPDNGTAVMKVADVDGVTIAGILFDAGPTNSPVLLEVGPSGSSASHAGNPTFLYDVFCRVGGAGAGKATICVTINSNDVVGDDFWIWRADHGAGVGWTVNTATNGVIINGNNVTFYGLFVEHFQQYQTIWNGNGGRTYFYQSECPYDAPNQAAWMNGSRNGWASYKVPDTVATHEAWGLGVYCVYTVDQTIKCYTGIEAPVNSGVKFHHMIIVSLGYQGEITHVINDLGGPVGVAPNMTAKWNDFP
jgi:hypothetical protein